MATLPLNISPQSSCWSEADSTGNSFAPLIKVDSSRAETSARGSPMPGDDAAASGRKATQGDEGQLVHLTGARSLLSLWILADHFAHRASVFTDRANVAVNLIIIMSGFVTHWAYGSRELWSLGEIAQFFVRRLGRVVLTTYLAMFLAVGVMAVQTQPPEWGHMARCMLFLEPWLQPEEWCPDGQTWTIAALMPSWLLYPVSKRLLWLVEVRGGTEGLLLLLLGLWTCSLAPSLVVFSLQGGYLSNRQHNYAYVWPPSQLADFAIGMVAASLARRHEPGAGSAGDARGAVLMTNSQVRGFMADCSMAFVFAAVLLVPSSGYHEGWEPLFNHALGPLLAAFLFGSTAAGGSGVLAWLLSARPLARVGKYSFEVFLFQWPFFSTFEIIWLAGLDELLPIWTLAATFMVVLYIVSGLYAEFVEAPFVKWLRGATESWTK
eukprot:TRINITY_DN13757_c0_g2_i1.p1 TRINITY_DN13757_c0_g2~~TRINITY_DN13757_c0_g2_i1.p1  ORF type:complete len:454 (-),score=58.56 TRINITY_DN13757_c0_g2_i1:21-1328(-)